MSGLKTNTLLIEEQTKYLKMVSPAVRHNLRTLCEQVLKEAPTTSEAFEQAMIFSSALVLAEKGEEVDKDS